MQYPCSPKALNKNNLKMIKKNITTDKKKIAEKLLKCFFKKESFKFIS